MKKIVLLITFVVFLAFSVSIGYTKTNNHSVKFPLPGESIANIKLQVEEVSEAKWCSKEELNEFVKNEQILPHIREYEILNEILK